MKKQNNNIKMVDWTGKILFEGSYKSKKVDEVLLANKCEKCEVYNENEHPCPHCNDTGYTGDFEVVWIDEDRTDNVYGFINY
jgi:hypothetical protein